MKGITATFWVEIIKIRKSKIFWLSVLFFLFVALMMGILMFVSKYPEIAGKMGMVGTKASMLRIGEANWTNFFNLLNQGIAGIGLVGYGFITSWVFGREYSDHTVKDLLALPVSREYIVMSKMIVIVIWCILLSILYFFFGLLVGKMIGLTDWSGEIVWHFAGNYTAVCLLSILLCTPVAFVASYARGYLVPLGFVILTLIVANFTGLVGLGPYFPWSIPGIISIPTGKEEIFLNTASYIILIATSLLGLYGTLAWWKYADHKN
jgi:ABC-2 type transport system permease protein